MFGIDEDKAKPIVYIGETKDGIKRIKSHDQKKDFWNYVVLIISKTNSFTKTHIAFLEELTIRKAREADRFELENSANPQQSEVPEQLEADLLDSYDTIKMLLSTLGYPIFEKLGQPSKSKKDVYYSKGKDGKGEGQYTDEGFVVFKSSICNLELSKTAGSSVKNLRDRLIVSGVLKKKGNVYVFESDYLFNSPSAASNIILARKSNGWIEWKDKSGKTLDELKRN
ncbi:GIY-YIG nuclease family protein [Bacteroidota bacterium]